MNKILFPLKPYMQGPMVANLQDGLQFLLGKGILLRENEGARHGLRSALKQERERQAFAGATSKLVGIFQKERRLPATGEMDERASAALHKDIFQQEVLPAPRARVSVSGSRAGMVFILHIEDNITITSGQIHHAQALAEPAWIEVLCDPAWRADDHLVLT